jgi:hypothetical protein
VLLLGIAALIVLYKATRKFPREIIDVLPADAVVYAEADYLAESWPDLEAFLEKLRESKRYQSISVTEPVFRKAKIDEQIGRALAGLEQVREQAGFDPVVAAFSYKSALAVYAEEGDSPPPPPAPAATAPAEGKAKGLRLPPLSFVACTYIQGLRVRVAALFAEKALSWFGPEGVEIESREGYTAVTWAQGGKKTTLYFAVLQDLVVVSNRSERMEQVLSLAASGIGSNLSNRPEFSDAVSRLDFEAPHQAWFWTDFEALDRLLGIQKRADIKVTTFPFVYLARYANGLQRGIVDLKNTSTSVGTLHLDTEAGALVFSGLMLYSRFNPFLVGSYKLDPVPPLGPELAPADAVFSFSVVKEFREFWDQMGDAPDPRTRESFLKLNEKYRDFFDEIIQSLGKEYTVFFKPSPLSHSSRPDTPPAMPLFCLAARCPDPSTVAQSISGIFHAEIDRYVQRAPAADLPRLVTASRSGVEVTYFDNLPPEAREVSPDFQPGFYVHGDYIVVFSSLAFAFEVIDRVRGGRTLSTNETYAAAGEFPGAGSHVSFYVGGSGFFSMMQAYRHLLAREMKRLNWDEGNRQIRAQYGAGLSEGEMVKHRDAYERFIQRKQGEIAARLSSRFENLKIIRSLAFRGTYLTHPVNRTPQGLGFRGVLTLDLRPRSK